MSLSKRLLLAAFAVAALSFVLVPGASAGNFDEEKMGCTGENPAECKPGTVGQPYSLEIYLVPPDGGRGEDFGCATFHATSGTFPPGLSISDEGYIQGTPTLAGTYQFYLTVKYDKNPGCHKPASDDQFILKINPGTAPTPQLPKLTIGPESTTPGTMGSAYRLEMTANLPEPKTWSIVSGSLPPGLSIDSNTGVISGTPSAVGSYPFTVQAVLDAQRSDTKSLTIHVRAPLRLTASAQAFQNGAATAHTEVGVRFSALLGATGGLAPYTWTQTGTLPLGIEWDETTHSLTGRAEQDGTFEFGVTVTDAEGRTDEYAGTIEVAERLAIVTTRLKKGKVGRVYRSTLVSTGGVEPLEWRIRRGPLPKGIRFDKATGSFVGKPAKAGTWVIAVEIRDGLRVKATENVFITIAPSIKRKR